MSDERGRDRGLLHERHVEAFVAWAEKRGWRRVETKGHYEVLRLVPRNPRSGQKPAIFYQRARSTPHYTAYGVGHDLALRFINQEIRPHNRNRGKRWISRSSISIVPRASAEAFRSATSSRSRF